MIKANASLPVILMPAVLCLLFVVVFTSLEREALRSLEMKDTDDFIRLHQAEEFLQGGQWYDLTLDRMNPPSGTSMHWSRLPDLPLAAIILTLTPFVGQKQATFVALVLVPSILLLLTVYSIWAGMRLSAEPQAASIAAFYLLLCLPVVGKIAPGKLDHHAWQLMLMAVLWAATSAGARVDRSSTAGVVGGIAAAASLWIGLESLPVLVAVVCYLHLEWVFGNDRIAHFGRWFGLSLALSSGCVLLLHVPPSLLLSASCDTYAINWFRFALAISVSCAVMHAAGLRWTQPAHRFAVSTALAVAVALLVLGLDATCIFLGPYGELPARLHTELLGSIYEAQSVFTLASHSPRAVVMFLGFPVATLLLAVWKREALQRDAVCRLSFFLTLCCLCVSVWQIRAAHFVGLFAVPLAAAIAQLVTRRLEARFATLGPSLAVLLLLSPVSSLFIGVAVEGKEGDGSSRDSNDLSIAQIDAAMSVINQALEDDPNRSVLIVAPLNAGPAILARSPHSVIAAPYHRNHQGVTTWLDMRAAKDETVLRELLIASNAEYLLLRRQPEHAGSDQVMAQIAAGTVVPWLRRLAIPDRDDTLLLRVIGGSGQATDIIVAVPEKSATTSAPVDRSEQ